MQSAKRRRLKREDSDAVEALMELNGVDSSDVLTSLNIDSENQAKDLEASSTASETAYPSGPIRSTRKVVEDEDGEVLLIKGAWSPEEDRQMLEAVKQYDMDWKKVAKCVKGRSAKQCRDRYRLKLDPAINHGPWTNEEDELLLKLHNELGRQWTKIAKLLPGRTENAVKSRYSSLFRSRTKEWTDGEEQLLLELHKQGVSFEVMSRDHLPHRSEHAVKKRWEKLLMKQIAKQIKQKMPGMANTNSTTSPAETIPVANHSQNLPKLNSALAAATQSSVNRPKSSDDDEISEITQGANSMASNEQMANVGPMSMSNIIALNQVGAKPSFSDALNFFSQNNGLNPMGLNLFAGHGSLNRTLTSGSNLSLSALEETGEAESHLEQKDEGKVAVHPKAVNFTEEPKKDDMTLNNKSISRVKSRAGRLKRHSTSTTVLMQLIGEPLP